MRKTKNYEFDWLLLTQCCQFYSKVDTFSSSWRPILKYPDTWLICSSISMFCDTLVYQLNLSCVFCCYFIRSSFQLLSWVSEEIKLNKIFKPTGCIFKCLSQTYLLINSNYCEIIYSYVTIRNNQLKYQGSTPASVRNQRF